MQCTYCIGPEQPAQHALDRRGLPGNVSEQFTNFGAVVAVGIIDRHEPAHDQERPREGVVAFENYNFNSILYGVHLILTEIKKYYFT